MLALLSPSRLSSDFLPIGGLSDVCVVDEFAAFLLSSTKDGSIGDNSVFNKNHVTTIPHLVKAFVALHYQSRLVAGDSLLILNAGTNLGLVFAQLASFWGIKVLAVADSHDAKYRLEHLNDRRVMDDAMEKSAIRVIDLESARVGSEGAFLLKRLGGE